MALRETAHQCPIFVLPQSSLVRLGLIGPLPLFSTFPYRYVSFSFPSSFTRLWCLSLFSLLLSTFIGLVFYLGCCSLACEYFLLALLLAPLFSFVLFSALVTAGFFIALIVTCGLLLLYWFCSDFDWRVQRVTAKFSSSELSSHQMGHPSLRRTLFPS